MDERAMEPETTKIALYPGCSLEGTAASFEVSLREVLSAVGLRHDVLSGWSCCGATSAHAMDHGLYLSLALRNLTLAQSQGFDEILAPCAACYHRLASANYELKGDADLLRHLNAETGLDYRGGVKVRNVLDYLANVVGTPGIAERVVRPLSGLKVACYYGCLNTRVPRMAPFDDRACPEAMDRVVEALGAEPLDWAYKTECCGASLFVTAESAAFNLIAAILRDADLRGADCIAVACPMCHNNLDTRQELIRKEFGIARPLPTLFVSQLIGLAFGVPEGRLRIADSLVPFRRLGEDAA